MSKTNFKKGDTVLLQDGARQRLAVVVKDGVDNKNKVRVKPADFPFEISVTLVKNDKLYIVV